jgi:anionic cell wall polymer biosynthesis LytR-Cps2A-Psr (LCP) family protein
MEENNNKQNPSNTKKEKIILIVVVSLLLLSVGVLLYSKMHTNTENNVSNNIDLATNDEKNSNDFADTTIKNIDNSKIESDSSDATIPFADSTNDYAEVDIAANNKNLPSYMVDKNAGKNTNSSYTGRRINISITGLDGRLGRLSKLADANHIVSILVDIGEIEIISIPRDTYCDLGYTDSTGLNKLTICRSNKGRQRYHKELCRIAKVNRIDYWVEFGFSQAMGIIEFLGYKEPQNTLQVLRNRKGLGGDDYQRCYTQGQFIRQAILSHFGKFTGTFGGILARAGIQLVETNLTGDKAVEIIDLLEKKGFPKSSNAVRVQVRPAVNIAYKVYDFSDDENIDKITKKIEKFNNPRFKGDIDHPQPIVNVEKKLNDALKSAVADSAKKPTRVISKLNPYFEQRAWYQVKDKAARERIRNEFGILLSNAYLKKNNKAEADAVNAVIEADKKISGYGK